MIFVGHSVSCSAGIIASILEPNLFKKLILIGPSPCFLNLPPDYQGGFEKDDLVELLKLMDQNYIGWADYLSGVVSGTDKEGKINRTLNNSFCSTDHETAKVFAKTTFFADDRDAYQKVGVPCLVLHHKHDSLVPSSVAQYIHQSIPENQLVELDVHGHCAHMSHPDLVIKEIQNFIE